MDVSEKLVELLSQIQSYGVKQGSHITHQEGKTNREIALHLIAHCVTVQERARPLEEWGEDYGDVMWWKFPIEEPPYVGSPLDANWPAYHTHWTTIPMPQPPKGE